MPTQKPGRSKQNYRTPPAFLAAVRRRLGIEVFSVDLAADNENAVAPFYFSEQDNALVQSWRVDGWAWCNPPFAHIAPWVERAYRESRSSYDKEGAYAFGGHVAMLLPAGVGANWWRDWVDQKCRVLLLNGRISFDGKAPYPKDCVLLLYGPYVEPGYEVWTWCK